ncbi:MAG: outer membrane beta-barrel protein [Paludibacter sp.]
MKRILSISLIILILSTAFSLNAQSKKVIQKKKAQISLDSLVFKRLTNRFEVGYNNPSQYGTNFSTTYFNGIKVGLTTECPIINNLSLLSGVLYNFVYSDKLQVYPGSTYTFYSTSGHFINIPLHIVYNYPVSNELKFSGFAGPTLNIGISQKKSTFSTVAGISTLFNSLSYTSDLNRLDLQLGFGLGVQWKRYQVKGGYDFGLLNINRLTTGNMYQKGWYVSLSVTL